MSPRQRSLPGVAALTLSTIVITLSLASAPVPAQERSPDGQLTPSPAGAISARVVGSIAAVAPAELEIDIEVIGASLDRASGPIEVVAELPVVLGLRAGASTAPWVCAQAGPQVRCSLEPAAVSNASGGHAGPRLDLPLAVATGAPSGLLRTELSLVVPGEPDEHLDDNATAFDLMVTETDQPVLEVLPAVADVDGTTATFDDRTPRSVALDEELALTVHNRGIGAVPAGSVARVALTMPLTVAVDWRGPDWTCVGSPIGSGTFVVATLVSCDHMVTDRLDPDDRLPPLVGDVNAVRGPEGAALWPVRAGVVGRDGVERPDTGLASAVSVDVTPVAAELSLSVRPIPVRSGVGRRLWITVENLGDGPAASPSVLLELGEGAVAPNVDGCHPFVLVERGPLAAIVDPALVRCEVDETIEPGGSAEFVVDVSFASGMSSIERAVGSAMLVGPDAGDSTPVPLVW